MTLKPRTPKDLLLAPLAAEIDLNLQSLRDRKPQEIAEALALTVNDDTGRADRTQRETWILTQAVRDVDLHHWDVALTDDGHRLRLSGGSVSIDLGLSATIVSYITSGSE